MLKRLLTFITLLIATAGTIFFSENGSAYWEFLPTSTVETVVIQQMTLTPITETQEPTFFPGVTDELLPEISATVETTSTVEVVGTPVPTKTNVPEGLSYVVQKGTPRYLANFTHPMEGCSWQGIAGQVFSSTGQPVTNLIIKVTGMRKGEPVSLIAVSGMVDGLPYGPGSYEIVLGNEVLQTNGKIHLQVFDEELHPLSEPFSIVTSAECSENLIMINFVQN